MSKEQELINELQEYLDTEDTTDIVLYPEEVQMCIDALENQMTSKDKIVVTLWMDEIYVVISDENMMGEVKDIIEYATYNYTEVCSNILRVNGSGEERYHALYQIVNEFKNVIVK